MSRSNSPSTPSSNSLSVKQHKNVHAIECIASNVFCQIAKNVSMKDSQDSHIQESISPSGEQCGKIRKREELASESSANVPQPSLYLSQTLVDISQDATNYLSHTNSYKSSKKRKLNEIMISDKIWIEKIMPFYTKYNIYKNEIISINKSIRYYFFQTKNINDFSLYELDLLNARGLLKRNRLQLSVCIPSSGQPSIQVEQNRNKILTEQDKHQEQSEQYIHVGQTEEDKHEEHTEQNGKGIMKSEKEIEEMHKFQVGSSTDFNYVIDIFENESRSDDSTIHKTHEKSESLFATPVCTENCSPQSQEPSKCENPSTMEHHEQCPHNINAKKSKKLLTLQLSDLNRKRLEVYRHIKKFPDLGTWKIASIQDKELLQCAVQGYGCSLRYGDKTLRSDRETVIMAVCSDGLALQYAFPHLKADKSIVILACQQNGMALEFADLQLRKDIECCMAAASQNGLSLQFAFPNLRSNPELILEAIRQNGGAYQFADPDIVSGRKFLLEALKTFSRALLYAPAHLRHDENIIRAAVNFDGLSLQYAPHTFFSRRDIAIQAIKQNGRALQFVSDDLRLDKDIALTACAQDGLALEYVLPPLQHDREVVSTAIKQNLSSFIFVEDVISREDFISLLYASAVVL